MSGFRFLRVSPARLARTCWGDCSRLLQKVSVWVNFSQKLFLFVSIGKGVTCS